MQKISYFSYKGGAGRSSLSLNTVPLIAQKLGATSKNPVVVVDLDIDSAGLTFLLKSNDSENTLTVQKIVNSGIPGLAFLPEDDPIEEHPFFSRLIPAGNEFGIPGTEEDKSILFLRSEPGVAFDNKSNYDKAGNIFEKMRQLCVRYKCKALIFDTPAGDQLTASWALDTSNKIVTCMRITHQFRMGTANFLKRKDKDFFDKEFILVPNAVPREDIYVDGVLFNYESVRTHILSEWKEYMSNNKLNTELLEGRVFGIPEVKRFKIKEGILLRLDNLRDEELEAFEAYKKLADILTRD